MEHAKRVRVIKGGRAGREAEPARNAVAEHESDARRDVRDVVSDWVRDHRRRSEEFRRNYSTLLCEMGFKSPRSCDRVA
jgi:hypothetical protein